VDPLTPPVQSNCPEIPERCGQHKMVDFLERSKGSTTQKDPQGGFAGSISRLYGAMVKVRALINSHRLAILGVFNILQLMLADGTPSIICIGGTENFVVQRPACEACRESNPD